MNRITVCVMMAIAAVAMFTACESDHHIVETDWTTLESVELQHQYNKYMDGEWVYQYDDSLNFIELSYSFNTKDSTFTGYYNELIYTALNDGEEPEWHLLWQGSFSGKWVLLYSVDLEKAYIHMDDMVYKNVHGVLAKYDVLAGRALFYGAGKDYLRTTTPLTFKRIDMHHPKP